MGKFYVQTFLVTDSGGPGWKVTADLLQHVWDTHASGEDHQALLGGTVRSEYTDEVAEKRCGDSGKVNGATFRLTGDDREECF